MRGLGPSNAIRRKLRLHDFYKAIKYQTVTLSVGKSSLRAAIQLTLPKEHGSWSLALEPVAFGLLVAPSAAGAALAVAAVSGFFLRRPIKLALSARQDARQPLAILCMAVLVFAALSGLFLAARFGASGGLWPLLPAVLAGGVFAWCDDRNAAREGAAEVAGAVTFGILPAAFGALAGWNVAASLALAAVMLVRSVPTVLTVRTCLRVLKGQAFSIAPAVAAAAAGIFLAVWLMAMRLAPWTAVVFALVFGVRTASLLLWRPRLAPKTIGITEAFLGVLMVLVLALTW